MKKITAGYIPTAILSSVPVFAVKAAEAYCLGNMRFLYILAAGEVCAGPCDFKYPVICPRGKPQLVESGFKHGFRFWGQMAYLADDIRRDAAVALDGSPRKALLLYFHGLLHALCDGCGAFLRDTPAEVAVFHGLYLYLDIDAVQYGLRYPVEVRGDFLRRAGAFLNGIAEVAAGTGVHRGDQHYVAGVAD